MAIRINLKDLFMIDRITEREDHLVINEGYYRVLAVTMLPEQVHFGWFNSISYIPGVTISVEFIPYTQEEASQKIDKERIALGGELLLAQKQGNTRRYDILNEKYAFYRQLLAQINMRRTSMFAVTVVILVTAPSLSELNEKHKRIQDIMGATKLTTMYLRQAEGLRKIFPGQAPIKEHHDMTAEGGCCMAPFINVNISHPSGIFFGINETGSPCFLDLFIGRPRLFGPHMFICGMTRSGKSYTLKGIIARSLAIGRKVAVIDPEGEYRKIAQFFSEHTEFVRLHPEMEVMFNPFDLEPEEDEGLGRFVNIAGKVDEITSFITAMVKMQSGQNLSIEETSIIANSIREEYENRGITKNPESLYTTEELITEEGIRVGKTLKQMPTFSSLAERLKNNGQIKLYNIIREYCKGGSLGFFDGQTRVDLRTKQLIIFDISALRNDNSKMFAMSVLLSWLWEKYVKNKAVRKHLIVDEAWLMMRHDNTAQFMSDMARRGAKYNTSFIAASQSFREFTTQEGIVFMQQCNTKFFLKLETQDARALGEIFDLSPTLVERIETFMPGQGILRMGKESGVVKFHGFPIEEEFLTSDPQAVALR